MRGAQVYRLGTGFRRNTIMSIGRRTFFRQLATVAAMPVMPKELIVDNPVDEPPVDLPPVDEIWLEEWQAAPRIPIVESTNNTERYVIRAMRLGEPVSFLYFAGSEPGKMRRVRPAMLYRVEGFDGVYLTGYCEDRQDTRTFRMDRVRIHTQAAT